MVSTIWTDTTVNSTTYVQKYTDIEYDESGKTYDTLATYYDGDELSAPFSTTWTDTSVNSTVWS